MYLETVKRIMFNSYPIAYVDSHTKFGPLSPGQSWSLQDSQPSSKDRLRHVESYESTRASSLVGPKSRPVLILAHNFSFPINYIIPASLVLLRKLYIFSPTKCLGHFEFKTLPHITRAVHFQATNFFARESHPSSL